MQEQQKVRFLKSPTGKYLLAYFAGDVGYMPTSLIAGALQAGDIELVDEPTPQRATAPQPEHAENAMKKHKKWGSGK